MLHQGKTYAAFFLNTFSCCWLLCKIGTTIRTIDNEAYANSL